MSIKNERILIMAIVSTKDICKCVTLTNRIAKREIVDAEVFLEFLSVIDGPGGICGAVASAILYGYEQAKEKAPVSGATLTEAGPTKTN